MQIPSLGVICKPPAKKASLAAAPRFLTLMVRFTILLALLLCLFPKVGNAQFGSSITGTVTDTTGAVVPHAKVTLLNPATNEQRNTTSSAAGFYQFTELGVGSYTVSASAAGYKTQTIPNIAVSAQLARGLDVKLSIGDASEHVTVNSSDIPLVQTTNAGISSTITTAELTRLPTFGRDPYELLRTGVGITGDGARSGNGGAVALPNNTSQNQSNYGIFQTENQIQISAAGQRVTSNTYELDGVTVDSLLHGGSTILTPSIESDAQVTVLASNYDAAVGRTVGAHIETVTKAGSNKLHGSAFFQYDEPGLNAYQPYGGPTSTPGVFAPPVRDDLQERDWAASLGGPILKNKLFGFVSYEGVKSSVQSFSEQYVPTPQYYSGIAAARPGGLVAGTLGKPAGQAVVHATLAGNCSAIQSSTTATVCQPVGSGFDIGSFAGGPGQYLPDVDTNGTATAPNLTTGAGLDGIPDLEFAQIDTPSRYRGNQFHARGDWYVTARDQIFGEFYAQKLDQISLDPAAGAAPDTALPFKPLNSTATAVYIHTFNSTLINEARANYTRFADNQITDSAGVVNWGVPGLYAQGYNFGSTDFSIRSGSTTPYIAAENTYEFRDTVTKVIGSQSLRMGVVVRKEQDNDDDSGLARPSYAFQGIWDLANDAPLYEGIAANPNTGGVGDAQRYFRRTYLAGFVQDDWKATPTLTVNLGLRYEYFGALTNHGFDINNLVLSTTPGLQLIDSKLSLTNHLYPDTPDAISPKFGFAWAPAANDGKLVFHGGFGVSFDNLDEAPIVTAYENGPGYFNYGLCCAGLTPTDPGVNTTGIVFEYGSSDSPFSYAPNPNLATGVNPATGTPNNIGGNGQPVAAQIETYSVLPHMKQPTLYNYSFDTQLALPFQMSGTVGYQGASGFHFLRLVDQNFLYNQSNGTCATGGACTPGVNQTPFNNSYVPTSDVHTDYNALNVHVEKRMQHGVSFSGTYTFSKGLDNASQEGPGSLSNQTDPGNPRAEYGPSDFDVRNRFTAVGLWTIPGPHGNALLKTALSGWQVNGDYTWHTGFPWTPVIGVPSVAQVNGASVINPTRPTGYGPGSGSPNGAYALSSCSNSRFIQGGNFPLGGANYFAYGNAGAPGIGRNSFRGPCYIDTDMSLAKEVTLAAHGHPVLARFTANFYNIFNRTNLNPINFGSSESLISNVTTAGTHVNNPLFGLAPNADSGRVIEFTGRIEF
jgi:hypothetical protein